ncbi:MAG: hypothetical protein QG604_474 [Candidatus Dependentiae bacterium]|nr:hypothetical protein [Candidatus Dependentiae bacterium]
MNKIFGRIIFLMVAFAVTQNMNAVEIESVPMMTPVATRVPSALSARLAKYAHNKAARARSIGRFLQDNKKLLLKFTTGAAVTGAVLGTLATVVAAKQVREQKTAQVMQKYERQLADFTRRADEEKTGIIARYEKDRQASAEERAEIIERYEQDRQASAEDRAEIIDRYEQDKQATAEERQQAWDEREAQLELLQQSLFSTFDSNVKAVREEFNEKRAEMIKAVMSSLVASATAQQKTLEQGVERFSTTGQAMLAESGSAVRQALVKSQKDLERLEDQFKDQGAVLLAATRDLKADYARASDTLKSDQEHALRSLRNVSDQDRAAFFAIADQARKGLHEAFTTQEAQIIGKITDLQEDQKQAAGIFLNGALGELNQVARSAIKTQKTIEEGTREAALATRRMLALQGQANEEALQRAGQLQALSSMSSFTPPPMPMMLMDAPREALAPEAPKESFGEPLSEPQHTAGVTIANAWKAKKARYEGKKLLTEKRLERDALADAKAREAAAIIKAEQEKEKMRAAAFAKLQNSPGLNSGVAQWRAKKEAAKQLAATPEINPFSMVNDRSSARVNGGPIFYQQAVAAQDAAKNEAANAIGAAWKAKKARDEAKELLAEKRAALAEPYRSAHQAGMKDVFAQLKKRELAANPLLSLRSELVTPAVSQSDRAGRVAAMGPHQAKLFSWQPPIAGDVAEPVVSEWGKRKLKKSIV